jgi:hypothetical protein
MLTEGRCRSSDYKDRTHHFTSHFHAKNGPDNLGALVIDPKAAGFEYDVDILSETRRPQYHSSNDTQAFVKIDRSHNVGRSEAWGRVADCGCAVKFSFPTNWSFLLRPFCPTLRAHLSKTPCHRPAFAAFAPDQMALTSDADFEKSGLQIYT